MGISQVKTLSIRNCNYEKMLYLTAYTNENFIKNLSTKVIEFDFNDLYYLKPIGIVTFYSLIESLNQAEFEFIFSKLVNLNRNAISYGLNIGFFQQLGLNQSYFNRGGATYISPKRIEMSELRIELDSIKKSNVDYCDEVAHELVGKISQTTRYMNDEDVKDLISFSIREMLRNIFDHSQAQTFWYVTQAYPRENRIEIAIGDTGVGFKGTVPFDCEYMWYNDCVKDIDAIYEAVKPGVTAMSNHSYEIEDNKNSGYGLPLVKKIAEETNGFLLVASGEKAVKFERDSNTEIDCWIQGTMIGISIYVDKLHKLDWDQMISQAERCAFEEGRNTKASKASKSKRLK